MPCDRFFYCKELVEKEVITLDLEESHHLINVMRKKPKASLEVINGKGYLATATLLDTSKKSAQVVINSVQYHKKLPVTLHLYQAFCRFTRLPTLIEKATELGADTLFLFPACLSEYSSLSSGKIEKLERVMISATKQCGALYLPKLQVIGPIKTWKKEDYPLFYGDANRASPPLYTELKKLTDPKNLGCIIGPEKGFTEEELTLMKALGILPTSWHYNILRTDTAPLVALSLMSHYGLTTCPL